MLLGNRRMARTRTASGAMRTLLQRLAGSMAETPTLRAVTSRHTRRGRAVLVAGALLVALVAPAPAHSSGAAPCVSRGGYLSVGGSASPYTAATGEERSEARLRYTLVCPTADNALGPGPYPALFVYTGYAHDPLLQTGGSPSPPRFIDSAINHYRGKGYVVVGVAVRGTNCSSGTYDFGQPDEARDGYDVVEWLASQPWSNGRVAMIGESYGATTQLPVAALRPPSLVAIAAQHPLVDFYRDGLHPGGIFAAGVASFSGFQRGNEAAFSATAVVGGAAEATAEPATNCADNAVDHQELTTRYRDHPWDDDEFHAGRTTSPEELARISVPVFTVVSWQDHTVGSRAGHLLSHVKHLHAVVANGNHSSGTKEPALTAREAFLDRYVLGTDAPYDAPRITVHWEAHASNTAKPRWTSEIGQWPPPGAKPTALYLNGGTPDGGVLMPDAPLNSSSATYDYVAGSGRSAAPLTPGANLSHSPSWTVPRRAGASLTYTYKIEKDMVLLGPASVDLYLAVDEGDLDTETDTDLQVTLSEVRPLNDSDPDGRMGELYVQQGWLRASHRALDDARSTPLLPIHRHTKESHALLKEGEPTLVRVELYPFGHVFRAGSRLVLTIEAPKAPTFESHVKATKNTVLHGGATASRLVLPVLAGGRDDVAAGRPDCFSLRGQPCLPIG